MSQPRDPALLIVDDLPGNLIAVAAALEPLGHRCIRASSGEEALKHVLVDDVAVIVLDVQMPGMDGFETAIAIKQRERSRDIPIVFLTAISREDQHRLRGYETGAVDYLSKPVQPELLRAKVAVFLELHLKSRLLAEQGRALADRTAELERSNADLEQFSYVASHDLQEPLRVVSGYLELLEDSLDDRLGPEERDWVERSRRATARMSSMIDDLLTYARAGSGGGDPEVVDLDAALQAGLDAVQRTLQESGGRVDAEVLGSACAVPGHVERVLQNLLANSLIYRGDDAPVIRVSSRRADGEVEVIVADNGIGVAEGDLERVFGRFERVAGQPAPGTGLGLAVCRRLVERSGGRIAMDRNAPHPGVTVRFTLPAAP